MGSVFARMGLGIPPPPLDGIMRVMGGGDSSPPPNLRVTCWGLDCKVVPFNLSKNSVIKILCTILLVGTQILIIKFSMITCPLTLWENQYLDFI